MNHISLAEYRVLQDHLVQALHRIKEMSAHLDGHHERNGVFLTGAEVGPMCDSADAWREVKGGNVQRPLQLSYRWVVVQEGGTYPNVWRTFVTSSCNHCQSPACKAACPVDAISKRPKRALPVDYGPAADPHGGPGEPVVESVWVEPYPDEQLGVEDGFAAPEARYEQREAVELAFVAALQLLPATQRAVLILREVLGFSAQEAADTLETTVASVNSALQRARKTVDERLPEQSQQATLRALGDDRLREIVDRYVDAWERNDVETVVAMLAEDATFAMPPLATWFGPLEEIEIFLAGWPLSGAWRWRPIPIRANGQPALAFYAWDEDAQGYLPFALNVLTLRGDKISDVVAFVARATEIPAGQSYGRWVDEPLDPERLYAAFERFGLPDRLD